jgi:hypothetical protein
MGTRNGLPISDDPCACDLIPADVECNGTLIGWPGHPREPEAHHEAITALPVCGEGTADHPRQKCLRVSSTPEANGAVAIGLIDQHARTLYENRERTALAHAPSLCRAT